MKKYFILGAAVIGLLFLLSFAGSVFETNDLGYYQVKQAAITGDVSIRNEPGTYLQNFGNIKTYKIADIYYFSKHSEEGGDSLSAAPIKVTFNGRSTADITGVLKYRLSRKFENQEALAAEYGSNTAVKEELIRQAVNEALIQSAITMTAEEAYAPRLAEFKKLAEDQLKHGIYEKYSETVTIEDPADPTKKLTAKVVSVKRNKDGNPTLDSVSPLKKYGIEIIQFTIKDIDFDARTDELFAKKKDAEMKKIVAASEAQKAQQDAITAKAQGDARIATAKANAEVEKKTAVINAQKEKEVAVLEAQKKFEVAEFEKKQAKEEAAAKLARGEAIARVNKLKVTAGLTPQERAEYKMKTAIGVAAELAKVKFPGMMVLGGGSNGKGAVDPFAAVGLETFMKINDRISNKDNAK